MYNLPDATHALVGRTSIQVEYGDTDYPFLVPNHLANIVIF